MEDIRRWSLRNGNAEITHVNLPTAQLLQWADQGVIEPGFQISTDGITWAPAERLDELGMRWYILCADHAPYGPITQNVARRLLASGRFPIGATLSQDPGTDPVTTELPLEIPENNFAQELQEARERIVLLEKELDLKAKRIDEMRQETAAKQEELNLDGTPDPAILMQDLEQTQQAYAQLKQSTQAAAEAAAANESALMQRIRTLENALSNAQTSLPLESNETLDQALFATLVSEADILSRSQEAEQAFLQQLHELAKNRVETLTHRICDIRKLIGDSPDQMRANAMRDLPANSVLPATAAPRSENLARIEALEAQLQASSEREGELQKRLISYEGTTHQLQLQVAQAERRTLDSLRLEEKLQETSRALERERTAHEEEHRENAQIQSHLLRRIEELERMTPSASLEATDVDASTSDVTPPLKKSSFGWLRNKS